MRPLYTHAHDDLAIGHFVCSFLLIVKAKIGGVEKERRKSGSGTVDGPQGQSITLWHEVELIANFGEGVNSSSKYYRQEKLETK